MRERDREGGGGGGGGGGGRGRGREIEREREREGEITVMLLFCVRCCASDEVRLGHTSCDVSLPLSSQESGRLLPCGVGEWVHVNCAVWSAEVYEECSGVLCAVHTAISRGKLLVRGIRGEGGGGGGGSKRRRLIGERGRRKE